MQSNTEHLDTKRLSQPVSLLIVDDSPYVLKSLRMVLRTITGLEVSTATDGAQAVREVTKSPPDFVLMDIHMPRMNGFEATRQVKRRAPDTKVVMMSVHDHEAVRKASRASGADDFVTKNTLHRSLLPRMKAMFPRLPVWRVEAKGDDLNETRTDGLPEILDDEPWAGFRNDLNREPWRPAIDFFDTGDLLVLQADLPGIHKNDVRVTIDDGMLEIQGRSHHALAGADVLTELHRERRPGRFRRMVSLPVTVEENKLEARFENGLLTLTLPKTKQRGET